MSKIVERIIKQAKTMGACNLIDEVHDLPSLAELFFTPQGQEFCIKNSFPTVKDFMQLKAEHVSCFSIFCSSGHVQCQGSTRYCGVGKTLLEAKFEGVQDINTIILMHGAEAEITVSNYAVVHIARTPDCKVHIINKDNTGIVLW